MCGRYSLTSTTLERFEQVLNQGASFSPGESRYNIAPSQDNPVILAQSATYELMAMRWGLIPHWFKTPTTKYSTINAKVETVDTKPFYRDAYQHRRCLVPADGYFEWRKTDHGKQPYYIHQDGASFAFAGLWEYWAGEQADPFHSYTIITGPAADAIKDIHPRMPLILPSSAWKTWLNPETTTDQLADILNAPESDLRSYPISTRVNNPRHDSPDILQPIESH